MPVLYYDPATVEDRRLVGVMCWRCIRWECWGRTIVAHLLTDDGVSSRRINWIECGNCRWRSRSTSREVTP